MTEAPDIILVDEATEGRGASADVLLISVEDAIGWIAEGRLPQPAQRPWQQFFVDWNNPSHDREPETSSDRQLFAIELIIAAIQAGQLKCVYVFESVDRPLKDVSRPRLATIRYTNEEQALACAVDWNATPTLALAYADPRQFKGSQVGYDWDGPDGFSLFLGDRDGSDHRQLFGFQFLWSDVLQIRPEQLCQSTKPQTSNSTASYAQISRPQGRSRPGRRTKLDHGGAVTNFVLKLQRRGTVVLAKERKLGASDDSYGEELMKEYLRLGAAPSVDTARQIAGGVVNALIAAAD